MRLEQALLQLWSTDATLSSLVPVERVSVGPPNTRSALPYAAVVVGEGRALARTNGAAGWEEIAARFHVWSGDADEVQSIGAELLRVFERAACAFDDGDVIDVRGTEYRVQPQPDGAWHGVYDFALLVRRA